MSAQPVRRLQNPSNPIGRQRSLSGDAAPAVDLIRRSYWDQSDLPGNQFREHADTWSPRSWPQSRLLAQPLGEAAPATDLVRLSQIRFSTPQLTGISATPSDLQGKQCVEHADTWNPRGWPKSRLPLQPPRGLLCRLRRSSSELSFSKSRCLPVPRPGISRFLACKDPGN